MARKKSAGISYRRQKVNSFLQQKISSILQEQDFAGITGLVTITAVEATPDMREAKIWFSVVNQDPEQVLRILERNIYQIQGELFEGSTMRIVPKVRFIIDRSGEFSSHINEVISHLHDE